MKFIKTLINNIYQLKDLINNIYQLKDLGYTNIDGLDPSQGLLDAAMAKKLYQKTFCCYVSPDEKTPVSFHAIFFFQFEMIIVESLDDQSCYLPNKNIVQGSCYHNMGYKLYKFLLYNKSARNH